MAITLPKSTLENIHDFTAARPAHRFAFDMAEEGHLVDARQLTVNKSRVYVDDAIVFATGFQLFTNVPAAPDEKKSAA